MIKIDQRRRRHIRVLKGETPDSLRNSSRVTLQVRNNLKIRVTAAWTTYSPHLAEIARKATTKRRF